MRLSTSTWLLNHPSRLSWVGVELLRPMDWRQRLSNAWWQLRNYGNHDAWHALWLTHCRSFDAYRAAPPVSSPGDEEA